MNLTLILLWMLAPPPPAEPLKELVEQIADSGRVVSLVKEDDERIRIAPGAPPLFAFRYLEGRERGRFGGLDLVLDDAGH